MSSSISQESTCHEHPHREYSFDIQSKNKICISVPTLHEFGLRPIGIENGAKNNISWLLSAQGVRLLSFDGSYFNYTSGQLLFDSPTFNPITNAKANFFIELDNKLSDDIHIKFKVLYKVYDQPGPKIMVLSNVDEFKLNSTIEELSNKGNIFPYIDILGLGEYIDIQQNSEPILCVGTHPAVIADPKITGNVKNSQVVNNFGYTIIPPQTDPLRNPGCYSIKEYDPTLLKIYLNGEKAEIVKIAYQSQYNYNLHNLD